MTMPGEYTRPADRRRDQHPASRPLLGRLSASVWPIPVTVGVIAAAAQFAAASLVRFPLSEGSAYYVAVARNMVTGHGPVIDAIWSYSTPPLVLPRPAFELWQPLASYVMAIPMLIVGPGFSAAQFAYVVLGVLLAMLAWMVARQTATQLAVPATRATWVALGAGLLVALGGPFLLAVVAPDSTLPFAALGVGACLLMPRAARGDRRALIILGAVLGLAYLTRMEAIYLGLTFALLVASTRVGLRGWIARVAGVALLAALVILPWWLRELSVFGTAFPTQVSDNLWPIRNEDIFGYLAHPSFATFAAQGVGGIVVNIANALAYQLLDVVLVPGGVAIAIGLLAALVGGWRARLAPGTRVVAGGALGALLVSGTITFIATAVLFPIPTLWGTFAHAAGPLLVGLSVAAVLGLDGFVERVGRWRGWRRNNAWLAPGALLVLTLPIALLQVTGAQHVALGESRIIDQAASALPTALADAGIPAGAPVITNRPIWLSDALARPTLALPAEPLPNVIRLAAQFGARSVVVFDTFPTPLLSAATMPCFNPLPIDIDGPVRAFAIDTGCDQ